MSASAEKAALYRVVVDGECLQVAVTEGQGRPLVICNNFLANLDVLAGVCTALTPPTLCFDMPGIGGSDDVGRMRRMPALARLLEQLIGEFDYPEIDLMGIGWGGLLAQRYVRDYGARVRRLVLIATSAGPLMFPGRVSSLRRLALPRGLSTLAVDGRDARELFGGRRIDECSDIVEALKRAGTPTRRGYGAQIYALSGATSLAWLHRLSVPTLILAGDDDPIVPMVNARVLSLLIPRSTLSVMRGAGHWLLLERTDEAARRIEEFLASGRLLVEPDIEQR
ncbi:MAG: alpha/beta fold hydrolase [Salinisphaera sp.]|jgi:pimeloyl-ACP methyl ester carboxylesterase|nr:alpha/beta fold hydrolase [Salinisphaera sp.]